MANVSDVDVEHRVINSENSTSVPGESSTTVHLKRFYFAHILLGPAELDRVRISYGYGRSTRKQVKIHEVS